MLQWWEKWTWSSGNFWYRGETSLSFCMLLEPLLFLIHFRIFCSMGSVSACVPSLYYIFPTAQSSYTSFLIMFMRRNNPRIILYHQLNFFSLSFFSPLSLDWESKICSLSSSPEVEDARNLGRYLFHKKTGLCQKWILFKMGFSSWRFTSTF